MNGKRIFDICLASAGIVALSPIIAASALATKIETGSPVIFRQKRIGKDGEYFTIHKIRTMDPRIPGPLVSRGTDPRITRVGGVLRRAKLDELPQLYDVLRGKMSLVGPRPEVPEYVAYWPDTARSTILSVRPGITDPVTLSLRDEQELLAEQPDAEAYYISVLLPEKVSGYEAYVRRASLRLDLDILCRTFWNLVRP